MRKETNRSNVHSLSTHRCRSTNLFRFGGFDAWRGGLRTRTLRLSPASRARGVQKGRNDDEDGPGHEEHGHVELAEDEEGADRREDDGERGGEALEDVVCVLDCHRHEQAAERLGRTTKRTRMLVIPNR